jgi:hypothetical protein
VTNERAGWLTPKLVLGVCVMAVGGMLALENLGMVDAGRYLRWWPAGLVAIGLLKWFGVGTPVSRGGGAILTAAGVLLLLGELDFHAFEIWDLWPLVLIAAGFAMISGSLRLARGAGGAGAAGDASDFARGFAFMGGVNRKLLSPAFRGGDLTAVMGGVELDLRGARIEPGTRPVIETFVWWGGIDLTVPENWKVTPEATVLLGAFEDHTKRTGEEIAGEIVVRGLVVMGGIEVKN